MDGIVATGLRQDVIGSKLTPLLGLLSLGLGSIEVAAPGWFARRIGIGDDSRSLVRIFGIREVMSGVGILLNPRSSIPIWSRVAGDAMDFAALCGASAKSNSDPAKLRVAKTAVAGVAGLDLLSALAHEKILPRRSHRSAHARESIAINKTPQELYSFWRDFRNMPRIMSHVDSVELVDQRRSHWTAHADGNTVEWDSEVTADKPNELISWRSVGGSDISTEGTVKFSPMPGGRGTAVNVDLQLDTSRTRIPRALTGVVESVSKHKIRHDLKRLKQVMETGEIATTRGQSSGRPVDETWLDEAARF